MGSLSPQDSAAALRGLLKPHARIGTSLSSATAKVYSTAARAVVGAGYEQHHFYEHAAPQRHFQDACGSYDQHAFAFSTSAGSAARLSRAPFRQHIGVPTEEGMRRWKGRGKGGAGRAAPPYPYDRGEVPSLRSNRNTHTCERDEQRGRGGMMVWGGGVEDAAAAASALAKRGTANEDQSSSSEKRGCVKKGPLEQQRDAQSGGKRRLIKNIQGRNCLNFRVPKSYGEHDPRTIPAVVGVPTGDGSGGQLALLSIDAEGGENGDPEGVPGAAAEEKHQESGANERLLAEQGAASESQQATRLRTKNNLMSATNFQHNRKDAAPHSLVLSGESCGSSGESAKAGESVSIVGGQSSTTGEAAPSSPTGSGTTLAATSSVHSSRWLESRRGVPPDDVSG